MQWEISPATIVLIVVQTIGFIVAFVRAYDNAATAKKKAEDAADDLTEYKKYNDERHAITTGAVALIRETFVHKDDLNDLKASIERQFNTLNARLDTYFMKRGE